MPSLVGGSRGLLSRIGGGVATAFVAVGSYLACNKLALRAQNRAEDGADQLKVNDDKLVEIRYQACMDGANLIYAEYERKRDIEGVQNQKASHPRFWDCIKFFRTRMATATRLTNHDQNQHFNELRP